MTTESNAEMRTEKWMDQTAAAWLKGEWWPSGKRHAQIRYVEFRLIDIAYEMSGSDLDKVTWMNQAWAKLNPEAVAERVLRLAGELGSHAEDIAQDFFEAEEEKRRAAKE